MVAADALRRFLDVVPETVLVVVDEAYHEYVDDPGLPRHHRRARPRPPTWSCCPRFPRSSAWPVCGWVRHRPGRHRPRPRPGAAPVRGQRTGTRGGGREPGRLRRDPAPAGAERRRPHGVQATFARLGLRVFLPSPFVCAAVGDGRKVAELLLGEGVVARPLDQFGDAESIRVTVGTPEENAIFDAPWRPCGGRADPPQAGGRVRAGGGGAGGRPAGDRPRHQAWSRTAGPRPRRWWRSSIRVPAAPRWSASPAPRSRQSSLSRAGHALPGP